MLRGFCQESKFGIGIGIFIAHRVDIFYQYKKCKLSVFIDQECCWPPAGGWDRLNFEGYSRAPPLKGTGPGILSGFQTFTYKIQIFSRASFSDIKFTRGFSPNPASFWHHSIAILLNFINTFQFSGTFTRRGSPRLT